MRGGRMETDVQIAYNQGVAPSDFELSKLL